MTSIDTIGDSTNEVIFKAFSKITETVDIIGVKVNPYPESEDQQVFDIGRRGKFYAFNFTLINISGGDTAYTQLQTLKTIWKTKHQANKYVRKVTFAKPGTVIFNTLTPMKKTFYGFIQTVTPPWVGSEVTEINGEIVLLEAKFAQFIE